MMLLYWLAVYLLFLQDFSHQEDIKSAHFVQLHYFRMNTVLLYLFPHSLKVASNPITLSTLALSARLSLPPCGLCHRGPPWLRAKWGTAAEASRRTGSLQRRGSISLKALQVLLIGSYWLCLVSLFLICRVPVRFVMSCAVIVFREKPASGYSWCSQKEEEEKDKSHWQLHWRFHW